MDQGTSEIASPVIGHRTAEPRRRKIARSCPHWSPRDSSRLLEMGNARAAPNPHNGHMCVPKTAWKKIATAFPGRTDSACRYHYGILKSREEGRIRAYDTGADNPRCAWLKDRQEPIDLPLHTSLTALVLGDPVPGRSALDRRVKDVVNHRTTSAAAAVVGHRAFEIATT